MGCKDLIEENQNINLVNLGIFIISKLISCKR